MRQLNKLIVKDTPEVRRFCQKKLNKYCTKLELKPKHTPDIFFNGVCVPDKINSIFKDKKDMAHFIYGDGIHLMHINLELHKNLKELDDSIAHELVHLTNINLKHGKKFNKLVKELLEC